MARERKDYSIPLEEGLEIYEDATKRAVSFLTKIGLSPNKERLLRDTDGEIFDGRLPANVNSLNVTELGEMLVLMNRFANFVSGYEVAAKAEVKNKDAQLKLVKAKIRKSKVGNKEAKDDATLDDARYVEINAQYVEAWEKHALLENISSAARRNIATLSRLVETKKIEFEQGRRSGNATRPRKPRRDPLRR